MPASGLELESSIGSEQVSRPEPPERSPLVCTRCHASLTRTSESLDCAACGASFPIDDRIADFADGDYYDHFDPDSQQLTADHLRGLELEVGGAERRIRDYYAPLIRRTAPDARRVLDCGCGNGVSVAALASAGFEAWGNDLSQLRKWQWRGRPERERLVIANALRLPFADGYFDVVISSGVLEHVGVTETSPPHYAVAPLPDQHRLRVAFVRELGRVLRDGGSLFLDFPNGAFPIDFWHGNAPGSARRHGHDEHFLPTYREVRGLAAAALDAPTIRALSPLGRLQFQQAASHLHGRLFAIPARVLFHLMRWPGLRWLAASPLNPFLVIEIESGSPPCPTAK